jgi:hypothetical protein
MRLLVIGQTKIPSATKCLSWRQVVEEEIPVVGDYDITIIDMSTLTKQYVDGNFQDVANRLSASINTGIQTDSKIYTITAPEIRYNSQVSNYLIFPFYLAPVNEKGEAFYTKPNNEYFKKIKKWGHCFRAKASGDVRNFSDAVHLRLRSSCTTKHRHLLAFTVELYIPGTQYDLETIIGEVGFFPPQSGVSSADCILNLLGLISPSTNELQKLPPDIASLKLPGEDNLVDDLKQVNQTFSNLKVKRLTIESKLQELNSYKGILAYKGKTLEMAVVKTLEKIGVTLVGDETFEEDKTMVAGKNRIPVEIKGHGKGATEQDLRQIIMRTEKSVNDSNTPVRGLLIVNSNIDKKIEDRMPEFEPGIVNKVDPWGICLLSTTTLFAYLIHYLETGRSNIKEQLLSTVGVVKVPNTKVTKKPDKLSGIQ